MKKLLILILIPLALTACTNTKQSSIEKNAALWQRSDVSSALYMRGPKAQHQLHMDIASCVSEVKELSRLGTISNANPPEGIEMNVGLAEKWQSPRGNGPLYTEFREFHDFESCMDYKGWNRAVYVKPEHLENAKTNYRTTILGDGYSPMAKQNPEGHHEAKKRYNQ
jgi:hypothetical protein